jgi:hypothetical protein
VFRGKKTASAAQSSALQETLGAQEHEIDMKFNPTFSNDNEMTQWMGWDGARHFLSKHSKRLSRSILQYGFSYYDHAGCLNNYPALLRRHAKLCRLERIGGLHPNHRQTDEGVRRVRFVTYYTVIDESMP